MSASPEFIRAERIAAASELAGAVAHDLNNLLAAILGSSQLLIDQLPPSSPLGADALEIRRGCEGAAALTQRLMIFGRPGAPELLDLGGVLAAAAPSFDRPMGAVIRLEIEAAGSLARVRADPAQLEQALHDLVAGAAAAMPDGGQIRMGTQAATLTAELAHENGRVPPGRYLVLSVADEGDWIPPEARAKICQPSFESGLGHATVHALLQRAGGHLVVRSAPGRGTTYQLYFPAVEAPAVAPEGARS